MSGDEVADPDEPNDDARAANADGAPPEGHATREEEHERREAGAGGNHPARCGHRGDKGDRGNTRDRAMNSEGRAPTQQPVADHVRLCVESGGAEGHPRQPGAPTLLLTTRGRRSGVARRTAVIYGRDGDDCVVMAPDAGATARPDWYVNLSADPEGVITPAG